MRFHLPAALVGCAGLMDGIGPGGWRGFAELVGWGAACLAAASLLNWLVMRGAQAGRRTLVLAITAALISAVLAYQAISWLCIEAPMAVKILFTSCLQVVGPLAAAVSLVTLVCYAWRNSRGTDVGKASKAESR